MSPPPPLTRPADRRPRRGLARLVLAAVSLATAATGAEWLWRVLARANHRQQLAAFHEPLFELADGATRYRLRPGLAHRHEIPNPAGGAATVVVYHTDDAGRRLPVPAAATPGERILFVGDSYTFGIGVGDGEAFPHRAAELRSSRGRPTVAVNVGVPGYNAAQTLAALPGQLAALPPRHVVFGFVLNDAEPPTYVPVPPDERHLGHWSWLAHDARGLGNHLLVALLDDRPVFAMPPAYRYDYRPSWAPGAAAAAACLAAIDGMRDVCRTAGAGFSVVVLPDFTRGFDATYPYHGIHAQVLAAAARGGHPAVDCLPALRGHDAATLRVPGDGHPDAAGHRLLATVVADHLDEVLR